MSEKMATSEKKRKPNWTAEQNLLLTRTVEENKAVLLGKFGPGITAQKKREKWGSITDLINASFPGCLRTAEEVEKKWHNLQCAAKKEINNYKKEAITTGGGPTPCPSLSATSEVVWDILGDSVSISGIPEAMDSTLLQVRDLQAPQDSSVMSALDLKTLKALSGSEATVSIPHPQPASTVTMPSTFNLASDLKRGHSSALFCEEDELRVKKLKLEIECLTLKKRILQCTVKKLENDE